MKTIQICLATVALGFANISIQAAEPPPARSEKANKLLKERLDILLTVLDATKAKLGQNAATPEEVMNAQLAVYSALLDMSTNKEERIKIYNTMLDELKKFESTIKAMIDAGKISSTELKQHRLREIDIELSIEAERNEK